MSIKESTARPRQRKLRNQPTPDDLLFDSLGKPKLTAIEYLLARPQYEKDLDDDYAHDETNVRRALAATASLLKSKNYSETTVKKLIEDNSLNALIQNLLIKGIHESINAGDHNGSVDMMQAYFRLSLEYNSLGHQEFLNLGDKYFKPYQGTRSEQRKVLAAIKEYKTLAPQYEQDYDERQTAGFGTARIFRKGATKAMRGVLHYTKDKNFLATKIIILGAGPAGILTARTLVEIGFTNIQILDESGKFNDVWRMNSVSKGTINNPFNINFLGIKLPASTGRKGSGSKLLKFLDQVVLGKKDDKGKRMKDYFMSSMPKPIKAKVRSIVADDLNHKVEYIDADSKLKTITAPIVINALGLGRPTDLNDRKAPMKTTTPNLCGFRWQLKITEEIARNFSGKHITLIGLGNSTIEMLMQIQEYNRQGYDISYKVLTHYPEKSVHNPDEYIELDGKEYRVFRDLQKSNLVDLEGDIPAARKVYLKALKEKCIIADVVEWTRDLENKILKAKLRTGETIEVKTDKQFTLIGYKPNVKAYEELNISLDEDACPLYDYDGEVHRNDESLKLDESEDNLSTKDESTQLNKGIKSYLVEDENVQKVHYKDIQQNKHRTYKGYALIGAIRANDHEPNALVIPGIMDSLPKVIFNTILRTIDFSNGIN